MTRASRGAGPDAVDPKLLAKLTDELEVLARPNFGY
jgi:hypothetical protein